MGRPLQRNLQIASLLAVFLLISGCAALPKIWGTIFGSSPETTDRTPIYVYRADLRVNVDDTWFTGVGVTVSNSDKGYKDIYVESLINLDRVEIQTCAREDVCQVGKDCDLNLFTVDTGWFGQAGRRMTYRYWPGDVELGENCPLHIRVYDKRVLAAWFFLGFRNGYDLKAKFTCNGVTEPYAGLSVCQTKKGLIQRISFESPPQKFKADDACNMIQLEDKKTFEIRPSLGLCTGDFYLDGHWHGMDVIGYDEVLVR